MTHTTGTFKEKKYLTVIGKNSQIFVSAQTSRVNVEEKKNVDKNNEQIKIAVVSIRR